ncbi:Ig-like domain-containing protein [Streptomyces kronopolitis]|uniref:Ig-like domain-containing protein n=1 Tax=Streptomyces kronopolitis TaxID=1612435 RepID=UPI00342C8781
MALALVLNPATVVAGQTFTATATSNPIVPGEAITFQYDAQPNQIVNADVNGVAVATFTATATGPVVATGPTSGTGVATATVTAAPSCVVTVTQSPANPTTGQPVTLTTHVTCNGAEVDGAVVALTTPNGPFFGVTAGGLGASVNVGALPLGPNLVTATVVAFTGVPPTCLCLGSTTTTTVTVGPAATCAVAVTSSPTNPTVGQSVTLTATVTCNGAPVSGATVLFNSGATILGTGVTNGAGQATASTTLLPLGPNTVTATVIAEGTTCTCISVAGNTTVTVGPAAQTCQVTLTSSPANPTAGQLVTLTATVTCQGIPVPGASVAFAGPGGLSFTGTTNLSGVATATTSTLPVGPNAITATVSASGSQCTCSNVVATTTVTVGAAQSFTAQHACYTLNFPPLPWSFAHTTLTVTGATPGAVVTFHSDGPGGPVLCSAVADANGNASCQTNLTVFQLGSGYTATTPVPGGFLTSSSTLSPCIIS